MKIALNILLGLAAGILFLFVVGRPNPPLTKEQHRNVTIAFVATLLFIVTFNTIM